ncbi:hypothetical protein D9M68_964930 [compost metagenome]
MNRAREAFDCLGAGQRASAAFAELNWQRDTGIARRLYARFSQLLLLQEMRQALETAATLDISPAQHAQRRGLLARLSQEADSASRDVTDNAMTVLGEGKSFLRSLAATLAD